MKKLLTFAVVAALMGTTAPLTPTQAATTGGNATRIKYDYATGFQMGRNFMNKCPSASQLEWEQKREQVLQNCIDCIDAGRWAEADYWNGYYEALGEDYPGVVC